MIANFDDLVLAVQERLGLNRNPALDDAVFRAYDSRPGGYASIDIDDAFLREVWVTVNPDAAWPFGAP